jgi:hypothetical protein
LPAVEEQPTDEPVIEPTPTLPPQLLKISPENSVNPDNSKGFNKWAGFITEDCLFTSMANRPVRIYQQPDYAQY